MAKTATERKRLSREREKKKLIRLDGWFESKLYKQLMELIRDYKGQYVIWCFKGGEMATIEIKYSKGDKVYSAGSVYTNKSITCPDCLGCGKWTVRFADGEEIECECQTCARGWRHSSGYIVYQEYAPSVVQLTIGQVGLDEDGGRYMCEETGVGSGTIYCEKNLFSTKEEAEIAADMKYQELMKHIAKNNFKKRYDFADKLGTFGYSRAAALIENKKMQQWLNLIKA